MLELRGKLARESQRGSPAVRRISEFGHERSLDADA